MLNAFPDLHIVAIESKSKKKSIFLSVRKNLYIKCPFHITVHFFFFFLRIENFKNEFGSDKTNFYVL